MELFSLHLYPPPSFLYHINPLDCFEYPLGAFERSRGPRQKLGNRLFSLGSFVRDIGKQWTVEQQQGIFLKATMDLND